MQLLATKTGQAAMFQLQAWNFATMVVLMARTEPFGGEK
jgi:hypothetical protein